MITIARSVSQLYFPIIPESLHQLSVTSTLPLPPDVFKAFAAALRLIDNALKHDPVPSSWLMAGMVIVDSDAVTLQLPGAHIAGCHMNIMIFPVHVWKALHLREDQMVVCILEEMCHCFWRITDEDAVKDKVLEVVQRVHPDVNLEYLYPNLFVNGKRISANDFT